ncbi:hypothetical protein JR316_0006302 [Psilocybe cubensis]|uniref:Uncharacterized protein n=2 Tax=Psilocybe cubensis TaxID=181762 RepID=A0ACB8H3K4_PSICU|nr:hypothetical protein JR316_0006302 [Psilocybe cubensis]KAH9481775.1 hypothetical protein JR316_0006302 [Psilocybe cubensis]
MYLPPILRLHRRAYMLKSENKCSYYTHRTGETYAGTLDEDLYHLELWEEIPTLFNNRMTDEEFEIFVRLDGGVKFEEVERAPSDHLHPTASELDNAACYFNDEDLYQHLDDYDYPHGVDDECDGYMRDVVYNSNSWTAGNELVEESDGEEVQMFREDDAQLDVARYFYASDLCDRGYIHEPMHPMHEDLPQTVVMELCPERQDRTNSSSVPDKSDAIEETRGTKVILRSSL